MPNLHHRVSHVSPKAHLDLQLDALQLLKPADQGDALPLIEAEELVVEEIHLYPAD